MIIFALPPSHYHIVQPLDVTCFHSLKTHWDRDHECNNYMAANPEKGGDSLPVFAAFSAAFKRAMTRENIVSGFQKSGVYPLDRHAIAIPGEGLSSVTVLYFAQSFQIRKNNYCSAVHIMSFTELLVPLICMAAVLQGEL